MPRDAFSFAPQNPRHAESRPPDTRRQAPAPSTAPAAPSDSREPGPEEIRYVFRQPERKPEAMDSPQAYYLRDRTYFVRDSEFQTLAEIGAFRVVSAVDLARFGYKGDAGRMEREVRRLQQRLLSEKTITTGKGKMTRILTLTKTGKRLVQASGSLPDTQPSRARGRLDPGRAQKARVPEGRHHP